MWLKPSLLFLCVAALLGGGCKKGPTITTYPVTGKVTLRGRPLEGATITLANKNPDGLSAGGTTDSQGAFRVSTYVNPKEAHAGAAPGDYAVVITKVGGAASDSNEMTKMQNATPEERQRIMMDQWKKAIDPTKPGEKPKSEVPERYSNSSSTPLKITVVVGDNPAYDWDLTDEK